MWFTMIFLALASAAQMYMQHQQAQAEAQVARRNASNLTTQGDVAQAAAQERANRTRRLSEQRLSEIRAGYAKAGVTPEGTPLLIEADAAQQLELEALTETWKGNVEASNFRNQAALERWRARSIKSSAWGQTFGTALSGVASMSNVYAQYQAKNPVTKPKPITAKEGPGKSLLSGSGSYGIA